MRLRFYVYDDSVNATVSGVLSRRGRTVARFRGEKSAIGRVRSFNWRPRVRGRFSWCVSARDRTGNLSPRDCATVRVR
jgi:hypothetical protein